MPLYEYQCPDCGTFERMQKFSDPILTACPTCEKPVEKLLSAPAIQFKGTGWYVTDYAGKSSGKEGEAKEGEAKEGEAKEASAKEASTKGGKGDKDAGGSKSETTKKDSSSSSKADKKPSSS